LEVVRQALKTAYFIHNSEGQIMEKYSLKLRVIALTVFSLFAISSTAANNRVRDAILVMKTGIRNASTWTAKSLAQSGVPFATVADEFNKVAQEINTQLKNFVANRSALNNEMHELALEFVRTFSTIDAELKRLASGNPARDAYTKMFITLKRYVNEQVVRLDNLIDAAKAKNPEYKDELNELKKTTAQLNSAIEIEAKQILNLLRRVKEFAGK
jgi:hypothetical protein